MGEADCKEEAQNASHVGANHPGTALSGLSWVVWSALGLPGKAQIIVLYALLVFVTQYYLSMEVLKRVGGNLWRGSYEEQGMTTMIKEALGE